MTTGKIIALILIIVAAALVGGLVWLANAPMMPPSQTTEQAIPDDRIPR